MIVIVESPFAGNMEVNRQYAIQACANCFRRGETPFASHLLYPQILDELKPEEREQGITAGYAFWPLASKIVFYTDLGMSAGMERAMRRAKELRIEIEGRTLFKITAASLAGVNKQRSSKGPIA